MLIQFNSSFFFLFFPSEALEFMRVVGAGPAKEGGLSGGLESADVWMSHEVSLGSASRESNI